jgi:hypothetical protein
VRGTSKPFVREAEAGSSDRVQNREPTSQDVVPIRRRKWKSPGRTNVMSVVHWKEKMMASWERVREEKVFETKVEDALS